MFAVVAAIGGVVAVTVVVLVDVAVAVAAAVAVVGLGLGLVHVHVHVLKVDVTTVVAKVAGKVGAMGVTAADINVVLPANGVWVMLGSSASYISSTLSTTETILFKMAT